jgi:hypothetical protein
MKKMYSLRIENEEIIVETDESGVFSMHFDDVFVELSEKGLAVKNEGLEHFLPAIEIKESNETIQKVETSDRVESKAVEGVLRACCRIGNRYWCINQGCANTPCGWICG